MGIQWGSISDFKTANVSVSWEAFHNTLIAFGVPKKLVQLIGMCLKKPKVQYRQANFLSDTCPIKNGLHQ